MARAEKPAVKVAARPARAAGAPTATTKTEAARGRAAAPARRSRPPRAADLPVADDSLFFKLVRVVNLTARPFVESLARAHHLSLNEWRVMVVLASHPGVAATDVADVLGLDKMSVSRALAALARHGRLEREAEPGDARRDRLALSVDGQALYRRIGASAAQREMQLFGAVRPDELARLARTLDRLIDAVRRSEPEQG